MKNNKGFTLIELIGVISILSILSLIFIPKLIYQFKKEDEKIDSITEDIIKRQAEVYLENNQNYSKIGTYCISISTLIDNDYLEDNFKVSNKESIIENKVIQAKGDGNVFELSLVDIEDCED